MKPRTLFLAILLLSPALLPFAQHANIKTLWSPDTAKPKVDSVQKAEAISSSLFKDTFEVKVGDRTLYGTQQVVELEPKKNANGYVLPVVIGTCEMNALNAKMNGQAFGRPMTYDLMTNIFQSTSLKLQAVVISKLDDGVFYATLLLKQNGKLLDIDSRPSDAINLALRSNAPIYCERDVFNAAKEKKD